MAHAFNAPELVWDEHQEFRMGLFAQDTPQAPDTTFWAVAGAMHRRLVDERLIQPPTGVQH